MSQLVFKCSDNTTLFASRELVVQSLRLSYHKIAKVVPNAMLTEVNIIRDDGAEPFKHKIEECLVHDRVEHL